MDFVKLQDRSDWLKSAKLAEKTKIFSIIQDGGFMDCTNVPAHHNFSLQVKSFTEKYRHVQKEAARQAIELNKKSKELALVITKLAESLD